MEWLGIISRSKLAVLVDAKNRVVACDCLKVGDRRIVRDRKVVATTCGYLGPCLEDRCTFVRRDLGEVYRLRSAALDRRHSFGSAYVLHPFGILPEHRYEVALALICGDDKNGRTDATATPVIRLQREQ